MKICVVSDQAFPAWGGEGVATQNLCMILSRRGYELLLLTSKVPHPPRIKGIEVIRFPSIFIPQRGHFAATFFRQIVPIFKIKKIQVVHANLPTFLGWQSFLAAKKLNIPCVAGLHVQVGNVVPYELPPFFFFKGLVEFWFSYFYKMADLLISPSNLGKEILSRYSSCRIEVVSNGIDPGIFNPTSICFDEIEKFKKKFGLKDSHLLIYTGRLNREKNVLYLVKIMQILRQKKKNVKLLIVGKGELEKLLQKKIFSTGLDEMIILTGFLSKGELLCAYREADIFILPSLFELQSIASLEAMAMGCAILVGKSSQSAACELVKEGINGYTFDLKDPHDAAEKINFILSNPALRKSMQKASLTIVREHDIQESITKVEKLYHELLLLV
ncbi:glycosyltransferase [Candidatus Aerophobetes bacterium]|nr:glycosyltransferase [Candidatus Aerophobetes bacterium]